MKKLLILALLGVAPLFAIESGPLPAPTSATAITTATSRITYVRLVNVGGGTSVYCVLLDRTTNCSGSGCPLFEATFTADPQTMADVSPQGYLATSGFTLQCSGTGITYYLQYNTPQ